MSTDLIAALVAVGLAVVVVVAGLRRNLSEVTRENLPRFEGDSEPVVATGPSEEARWDWLPSPRYARWLIALDLLLAVLYVGDAIRSSDSRPLHAVLGAGFVLAAVVLALRVARRSSGSSAS